MFLVPAESKLINLLSSSSNPRDMEQARYWMWTRTRFNRPLVVGSSLGEASWEEKAFAEDLGGCTWPPRSYSCSFCRRDFRSAQALGGHMNVHRRDRARLKQSPSLDEESHVQGQPDKHQLPQVGTTHFVLGSDAAANPNPNPNSGVQESPPIPVSTNQKELLLFTSRSLEETPPPLLHLFIVPEVKIGEDNLGSVEFVTIDEGINICNKRRRIDEPNTCFFIAEQEILHAEVLNQIKPVEELDLELRLGCP